MADPVLTTEAETDPVTGESLRHQPDGTRVRSVALTAGGLSVVVVIAMGLMALLMGFFERQSETASVYESPFRDASTQRPTPRIQTDDAADMNAMRRLDQAVLTAPPQWVDRDAGVATIPIDRAIDMLVEHRAKEDAR